MVRFIDLFRQYLTIKSEIDAAIASIINESAYVGGKIIKQFEGNFAAFHQVKHCISVANGTDAIEIALSMLELPKGSEVLVPANTFIATSEAVTRAGYTVVFCDCDPDTYTISVADAKKRITDKTRAIISVHLYGHACDMDAVMELARENNLIVVEDCAQAHGCEFNNKKVGGFGALGTFSFYPGKNLGAYGDAGAIVTNDEVLAKKCRMFANHGRVAKYDHEIEGRNSRLDGIQAAVLDVKLKYLDKWLTRRTEVASRYLTNLQGVPGIVIPKVAPWTKHVWHLFVIRYTKRDQLQKYLQQKGIETLVHYPIALPKLKAYDYLGQGQEKTFASMADKTLLSLPIYPELTDEEIDFICNNIINFVSSN